LLRNDIKWKKYYFGGVKMKESERIRVVTFITPEADVKVEAMMKKLGMTKSKVISLAAAAGLDALGMAFDPNWEEYFKSLLVKWGQNETSPD